ncbi:MAG: saccharopine dehydrogenase NADP-binding domain-containing protein [Pseudomonadota bacterium]|nr:saccharopine dehydrogenase NADP-binding domain-containing protein [Pseudomonadota bacterium]
MILIYGVTGYTGELIVEEAQRRGLTPILAGRDAAKVAAIGARTGLATRVFPVDAPDLSGVTVLLNVAGPFSRTARPLVDACLRAGVHYLDVTGEIATFEGLAARDAEARAAGVLLLPGVGFDVVPSDCLALHLKERLPTATHLRLAIGSSGGAGLSHGTVTTAAENLDAGGAVRQGGRIVKVPTAYKTRQVDFGRGPRTVVSIPWGDVSTAWHTTHIPDIEVYASFPPAAIRVMQASNWLGPVLRMPAVKRMIQARIDAAPAGPTPEQRENSRAYVWGEVEDAEGRRAEARLTCPEGYTLTARTAVEAARRVEEGVGRVGFGTPAGVFGAGFVLGFEGVSREDLAPGTSA